MVENRLRRIQELQHAKIAARRQAALAVLTDLFQGVHDRRSHLRARLPGVQLPNATEPLLRQRYEQFVLERLITLFPHDSFRGITNEEARAKSPQELATGFFWHLHSRIPPIDQPEDKATGSFTIDLRHYAVSTLALVADIQMLQIFIGQRNAPSFVRRIEASYGELKLLDEKTLEQPDRRGVKTVSISDAAYEIWPDIGSLTKAATCRNLEVSPSPFAVLNACSVAATTEAAAIAVEMSPVELGATRLIARGANCSVGEGSISGVRAITTYRRSIAFDFRSLLRDQGIQRDSGQSRTLIRPV